MTATPSDIEQVLEQVRDILVRWQGNGVFGEVTVVVGRNQYQPEERPRKKHEPVVRGGTK